MRIKATPLFRVRRLKTYSEEALREALVLVKAGVGRKWISINEDRVEREIINSCIVLKNMAIVYKEKPLSLDFILEQLMENCGLLYNTYAYILTRYRGGEGQAAFREIKANTRSKGLRAFIGLLGNLEKINPAELVTYMEGFESALISQRATKNMRRTEHRSIITTVMSSVSVFAVLLNFVIVVVFFDVFTMLGQVF